MSFNFAESATRTTSLSEIMTGRTKIGMDALIKDFPNGVTIMAFDLVNGKDGPYPVFAFSENPNGFFSGGTVMKNVVSDWLKHFDGDVEACSQALTESGGCKFRFERGRTRNGNTVTKAYPLS